VGPSGGKTEEGEMALTSWDPFTTLARLDQDFDELVRRAWSTQGRGTARTSAGYVPAIEMRADGADVVITLELPGVDVDKDVDIEVAEGRLTISGERRDRYATSDEAGKVLVRELRYGSFRREFALPEGVGADDVEASYDHGMLEVRVHNVTRPVVPPQKVSIRAASARPTIEGRAEPTEG
jgi:HSP20 family protein